MRVPEPLAAGCCARASHPGPARSQRRNANASPSSNHGRDRIQPQRTTSQSRGPGSNSYPLGSPTSGIHSVRPKRYNPSSVHLAHPRPLKDRRGYPKLIQPAEPLQQRRSQLRPRARPHHSPFASPPRRQRRANCAAHPRAWRCGSNSHWGSPRRGSHTRPLARRQPPAGRLGCQNAELPISYVVSLPPPPRPWPLCSQLPWTYRRRHGAHDT